jgi:hypothetical protein
MKLIASFSNRVSSARHSFSPPMQHSIIARRR